MRNAEQSEVFVDTIWRWYATHKRTLPWRDLTLTDNKERGYRILVSEIMLQQTQVSRVKIVYKDFLERFNKIEDLARASNKEVILAWRGMGYNNRAIRLRDAAKILAAMNAFPVSMEELTAIPGIGHYTAAAVRNFAFNIPTPCLDTNIRRILHRTFVGPETAEGEWKKNDAWLLALAERVLQRAVDPKRSAAPDVAIPRDTRNWHAALMDFGSLVCTKRSPKWDMCPLTKAGIMKAAYKELRIAPRKARIAKSEPGRMIGATFVPNRIIRGRIVEELRDEDLGLTLRDIGARVCIDWSAEQHEAWLRSLIGDLTADSIVCMRGKRVTLRD